MGNLRERIARAIAPGMKGESEVRGLVESAVSAVQATVAEEVKKARMSMPISINYDPRNEGYRRLSDQGYENVRRDITPLAQDLMIELAYYLYDTSGLVKRFVRDTKNFVLGEGVSYEVENDTATGDAKAVIDGFWDDAMNMLSLKLEKKIEFMGLLGEQCWPVVVNPYNGRVWLSYVDPANIDDVVTLPNFPEIPAAVKLKGILGRPGKTLSVIREETDPRKPAHGRLVGDCFFWSLNNPPNSPRGRSDLIHLFDFINGFEEGVFDELDRIKLIKSFIWDVALEGATDDDIKDFLSKNKTPKAGSVRAHNERVKWEAVTPDMKHADNKALFDMMKTYISACANRPDSWLGSGGKAYQTEADLMGEPTFKELGSRQRYVKYVLEYMLRYVVDQAVMAGTLREPKGERFYVSVNMPEMTTKDTRKIVDGLFSLAQSLLVAESSRWITIETAARIYATVASQVGIEIDAALEVKEAAKKAKDLVTEDYAAREALLNDLVARIEAKKSGVRE